MERQHTNLNGANHPQINFRHRALRVIAIVIVFLVLAGFLVKIVFL